jgi:diguanylate cyclase (GGDEF)-like protein
MTAPLPDMAALSQADERKLGKLARKWAYLVSMSSYIPLPHNEIERRLLDLAHEAFDTVATEPLDVARAAAVGEQLVKLHCVGKTSLQASIDVLASGLMADERLRYLGDLGERVARTLGAVASGYADSVRWQTVEQQEGLNQALLEALGNAEQNRKDREAQHDEVVTELALLRNELSRQLLHDVLTALPNRQFFTTRLEHVLGTGSPTTVYHLEVNGLTTIRDGLGRPASTGLLRVVADRLACALAKEHAMVAHFLSGHFAILVESTAPAPDPTPVIEAINTALADPAYVDGIAVAMSANIGVVQSPPHNANPVVVLQAADLALRKAKRLGPARWARLEPGDDDTELRLAATFQNAWWTDMVRVEFRPRIHLTDGRLAGLDARLRWDHAELGALSHERCVALAERTGFGERLGRWLLDRAAVRLRSWSGGQPLAVAIPPSQATNPDLPAMIGQSGLPADRLEVSVPAHLAAGGPAAYNLTRLAGTGVTTAVHDFGAAGADVTCLSDMPVRTARLSPALTRRWADRIPGQALRNLVTLLHEAGATAVVDGIRTETEADWWRAAGADVATGPGFGPRSDFEVPADI